LLKKKISVDTALAEITLRKYEKPNSTNKRELARKVCLSLGLLQPGDSRDVVVDVLQVLLESKSELSSSEVERLTISNRKKNNLQMLGIAPSNIRRQLLRLRDLFLVEKVKNSYRIKENNSLASLFEENIEEYYLTSIINRVKDYLREADRAFGKQKH
jgi:DNA-binding transcriptional ArsR family regulator